MNIKVSGATVGATANLYAAGQLIGNKITLSGVTKLSERDVILSSVTVQDLTKQSSALNILIFDADPAATTFTNNAALDVADADLPKIIATVPIAATDYVALNDNSVACVGALARECNPDKTVSGSTTLYACVVCNGAPTYAANELSLVFGFV